MRPRSYHDNYMGITHLGYFLFRNRFNRLHDLFLKLWKRFLCPSHIHLFDETMSTPWEDEKGNKYPEHYLVCDACELMVNIESIETTYCDVKFKEEQ